MIAVLALSFVLLGIAGGLWFSSRLSGANYLREGLDRIRLDRHSLEYWDNAWASNPRRSDIIVCLTTIPSRLGDLDQTLKSLLDQSRSPQHIRLYLPRWSIREAREYEVPSFLTQLRSLEIIRCEDYGPATKFIPALQDLPLEQSLLIVDDDRLYPNCLVDNFHRWSQDNPGIAIGAAGWIVPSDLTDRELTLWRNLRQIPPAPIKSTRTKKKRPVHILEGYAGYLIKPKFFDLEQIKNFSQAPPATFYVDDVWMSAHCLVPRYVFPARRHAFNHPKGHHFDPSALWRINNGHGDPKKRSNTILVRYFKNRWKSLEEDESGDMIQSKVYSSTEQSY